MTVWLRARHPIKPSSALPVEPLKSGSLNGLKPREIFAWVIPLGVCHLAQKQTLVGEGEDSIRLMNYRETGPMEDGDGHKAKQYVLVKSEGRIPVCWEGLGS